jgi:two-component system LytT family response regulator
MSAAISTIVVDDERLARDRLIRLLKQDSSIKLVGAYASAAEAADQAQELEPQLVFLDVRMPEQDGFNLLETLSRHGVTPYVIFVTAFSDRPMDAFAVGAIDYILKPFDDARLARAVERAKLLIPSGARLPAPAMPISRSRARLLLSERGKVIVLAMQDIEFIQSVAKRVKIYAGGHCYSHRQSLGQLEEQLDPAFFVRVHRSTLVNVEFISEMHPLFHGDYELILKRGTRLTLSRRYRERLAPFFLR